MATIPRTYLTTYKSNLDNITKQNGQVISIWDADEVWYDAPDDGTTSGTPVRRKISGVRVITTLPEDENPPKVAMEDIVYVYIGDSNHRRYLPDGETPLYDLRVWVDGTWLVVGSNQDDTNVKTVVSGNKFYLVGSDSDSTTVGSLLKNTNIYIEDNKIYGYLEGTAKNATSAVNSTKALQDGNGNAITSYLRTVTATAAVHPGTTITFTDGDGTTTTQIITSDTTYEVYTASTDGLVPKTATTVQSDSTNLLLTGSGWALRSNVPMPLADKANKDGQDQNIANTYYKNITFASNTLTLTKGNGTTIEQITIPDTTYNVFDEDYDGLVPGPSSSDGGKYLRSDHTWQTLPTYIGATSSVAGTAGLVPPAAIGETNKYLKGDGTWGTTFSQGVAGLVTAPSTNDPAYSLRADGTWNTCPDTKNTAGATQDASKLFVVGAKAQSTEPQTYTNSLVFVDGNKLYQSNGASTPSPVQVVDVSSTQALTNKTYNGYTLGTACALNSASSIDPYIVDQQSFTGDGSTVNFTITDTVVDVLSVEVDDIVVSNYSFDDTNNRIVFNTAPANGSAIVVTYTKVNSSYSADDLPKNSAVISYVGDQVDNVTSLIGGKLDVTVIAPMYDETLTYAVDDYRMYEDTNGIKLYKCTTAVTVPEEFDPTKWVATTLIDVIKSL